jgi:hypothetical protein
MSATSDFGVTMRYAEPIERSLPGYQNVLALLRPARILDIGQIAYGRLNGTEFGRTEFGR